MTIGILIGGILGKIISRIFGKEFFLKHRAGLVAGIAVGESLAVILGSVVFLIAKSIWLSPF